MKTLVFAVYDSKASAYGTPFFMPSVGVAVRMFTDLANDPKTTVHAHAEDYTLFEIGSYDDGPGILEALEKHKPLGLAAGYKRPDNQVMLPGMPSRQRAEIREPLRGAPDAPEVEKVAEVVSK